MADVLVTGGTGELGRRVVKRLVDGGHTVRITSHRADATAPDGVAVHQADLRKGTGLEPAVEGVNVIVHAASSPRSSKKVEVGGAKHLLAAIGSARPHLIYVSIVGVDRHPFPYYRSKWGAEQAFEASDVPWTIQRATQFHSLLHTYLSLPLSFLPHGATFQPIDVSEVADRFVELAEGAPQGRVDDIGGPEVLDIEDLLDQYQEVLGKRPRCVTVPAAGKIMGAFGKGIQTCPDRKVGTRTWHQFLELVKAKTAEAGD